jgi:hypothetical protein
MMLAFVFTVLGAYTANETGWVAAETGRQPWIVYGLLRTKDAVSHAVPRGDIICSIIMFAIIYAFLFAVWVHVMNDKIQLGPEGIEELEEAFEKGITKEASAGTGAGTGAGAVVAPAETVPPSETPQPPAPTRGGNDFWQEAGKLRGDAEFSFTRTASDDLESSGAPEPAQTQKPDDEGTA